MSKQVDRRLRPRLGPLSSERTTSADRQEEHARDGTSATMTELWQSFPLNPSRGHDTELRSREPWQGHAGVANIVITGGPGSCTISCG